MNAKTILKLEDQKNAADKNLRLAISQMWPEGSPVRVLLSSIQKVPSAGVVVGCYPGELCVRLDKLNRRGYATVKRVHWQRVCA